MPSTTRDQLSDKFFNAKGDEALVISLCSYDQSGCHDFCKNLCQHLVNSGHIQGVDHLPVRTTTEMDLNYKTFCQFLTKPQQADSQYKYIYITGCTTYHGIKPLLEIAQWSDEYIQKFDKLRKEYYTAVKKAFSQIEHCFIIYPPHLSSEKEKKSYVDEAERIKKLFGRAITVSVHSSGINTTLPHSIGLPNPVEAVAKKSDLIVTEDCYGLMYHRKKINNGIVDGKTYLNAYFKKIISNASLPSGTPITVMAINFPEVEKEQANKIALTYGIKIDYREKLPQNSFIKIIQTMASKGGVVSSDGVQSLMQSLYLRAQTFIYANQSQNEKFYQQIVSMLPEKDQSIARVFLGLSTQFELVDDKENSARVQTALYSLIENSIHYMNNPQSIDCNEKKDLLRTLDPERAVKSASNETKNSYNIQFKYLCALATLSITTLITGIIAISLLPIVTTGAVLTAIGILGVTTSIYGLFNTPKINNNTVPPDNAQKKI